MRLWVGRRGASLVAVGATLAVSTTGLAFASSPKHAGPDGQAAFAASARQVQAAEHFKAGNYIVVLKQAPAATYRGGVAGQRATAPGGSFAAGSPAVASYQGYLARHAEQPRAPVRRHGAPALHRRPQRLQCPPLLHAGQGARHGLTRDGRGQGPARARQPGSHGRPARHLRVPRAHPPRPPHQGLEPQDRRQGHRGRCRRLRHLAGEPGVRGQEAPAQEEGQRQQPGPDLRRRLPQDRVPQGGRQDLPRQVRRRSALQGEHLQQQADLGAVLRHGVPAVPAAQHVVAARVRLRA